MISKALSPSLLLYPSVGGHCNITFLLHFLQINMIMGLVHLKMIYSDKMWSEEDYLRVEYVATTRDADDGSWCSSWGSEHDLCHNSVRILIYSNCCNNRVLKMDEKRKEAPFGYRDEDHGFHELVGSDSSARPIITLDTIRSIRNFIAISSVPDPDSDLHIRQLYLSSPFSLFQTIYGLKVPFQQERHRSDGISWWPIFKKDLKSCNYKFAWFAVMITLVAAVFKGRSKWCDIISFQLD